MLIETTKGYMEESLLRRVDGEFENDVEHTTWVEYFLDEESVHRSVHTRLKKNVVAEGIAAMLA